ncbi:MAG: penicillin-binding transpeptidase domain-containing protein [candidate division KSB1 bacterium]|nr:penicillin-binding transpeptidase domain-containing protein [candidate division KSB1 bacterium]
MTKVSPGTEDEAARSRFQVVRIAFLTVWAVVFLRTAWVQLAQGKKYTKMAEQRYISVIQVDPERGLIRDRNGQPLVLNRTTYSLAADPKLIEAPRQVAARLARLLGGDGAQYEAKLRRKDTRFVWLARGLSRQLAEQIRDMEIPGLRLVRESKRAYPHGRLASPILGFVGAEGRGLSGLEFAYDEELRGKPGVAYLQRDARQGRYFEVSHPAQEAIPGNDLILTIDYSVQEIVEQELEATLDEFRAESGTVVVLRPSAGEILALADLPSFDPAQAERFPPERWRVRAVTDPYEPGSTFKLVTISSVLEEGIHQPADLIPVHGGRLVYKGKLIEDVEPHDVLTVQQVFEVSSNVGTAKLGTMLPPASLYGMARAFGFGAPTGIELPGEVPGILKPPNEWSGWTPAMIAIGYEVAVTPLQLAMAYAAVANDGILVRPHIVREIRSRDGKTKWRFRPEPVRRVLDKQTAQTLKTLLRGVVERGTGVNARVPGLRIYGKTGTAQRYDVAHGTYKNLGYAASFVGFAETEEDTVLILVVIRNPKGAYYGSVVAAPLFRRILVRMLRLPGQNRSILAQSGPQRRETVIVHNSETVVVPDVRNRTVEVAQRILRDLGLRAEAEGEGSLVAAQDPAPGFEVPRGYEVRLQVASPKFSSSSSAVVPRMVGRTLREAIATLAARGLTAEIQGSGTVVEQWPEPGKVVQKGFRCRLRCLPRLEHAVRYLE